MKTSGAFLLALFLAAGSGSPVLAKSKIVKITIKGADLQTPVEITDAKVLENFQVWTGPGTGSNAPGFNPNAPGFIVDWPQGPVAKVPGELRKYQVFFHAEPHDQIVYVVSYAFSPDGKQGYVYLPGGSDEWAGVNVRSIYRGIEGNWFRAWSAWERVARPLIEKAKL